MVHVKSLKQNRVYISSWDITAGKVVLERRNNSAKTMLGKVGLLLQNLAVRSTQQRLLCTELSFTLIVVPFS